MRVEPIPWQFPKTDETDVISRFCGGVVRRPIWWSKPRRVVRSLGFFYYLLKAALLAWLVLPQTKVHLVAP